MQTLIMISSFTFDGKTINLLNKNGNPYRFVILTGINGSGKTRIFKMFETCLANIRRNKCWLSYGNDKYIYEKYSNEYNLYSFKKIDELPKEPNNLLRKKIFSFNCIQTFQENKINDRITLIVDYMQSSFNGKYITIVSSKNKFDKSPIMLPNTNCAFGYGYINFNLNNSIINTNNKIPKYTDVCDIEIDKINDFKYIEQFLINIFMHDAPKVYNSIISAKNECINVNNFLNTGSGSGRFILAFNRFFKNHELKFCGIKNNKVIFKKNNVEIWINDLSSGEKQIIYHFCTILKNLLLNSRGHIFIDEPEISLHPSWQKNIFESFIELFKNEGLPLDNNPCQIFINTHSPYIIKQAYEHDDSIVINVLNGKKYEKENDDNYISINKILHEVFEINNIEYLDELIGKLIQKNNEYAWLDKSSQDKNSNEFIDLPLKYLNIYYDNKIGEYIDINSNTIENKTKYFHKKYVTFARNYFHHPRARKEYDKCLNANKITIDEALKIAIDDCLNLLNNKKNKNT